MDAPTRMNASASAMGRNIPHTPWRRVDPLYMCIAIWSGLYFALTQRLVEGSLFNSYPFISSDGFDWLFQGLALTERLAGRTFDTLPILRNPGFVAVTALDNVLAAEGTVILATFAVASYVSHSLMVRIGDRFRVHRAVTASMVVVSMLGTLAFYRLYVLADGLASPLLIAIAFALIKSVDEDSTAWFVFACACSVVAGVTQLYGLLPLAVGIGLLITRSVGQRKWLRALLLGASGFAVAGFTALILLVWRAWWAHEQAPTQLALIRLDGEMLDFYWHVWSFSLPFVLAFFALILCIRRHPEVWHTFGGASIALTIPVFMVLSLLYHWEDARFTAIYVQFVLLAVMLSTVRPARSSPLTVRPFPFVPAAAILVGLLTFAQSALIAPTSYWVPRFAEAETVPSRTWLGQLLTSEPKDRLSLESLCGTRAAYCSAVEVPQGLSPYQETIYTEYLRYRLRSEER